MSMELVQVRVPKGLIQGVDKLVRKGFYANKSDVIRDAIRRLTLQKQIGSIPNREDSVEEIKAIRKKLSKEKFDFG